jgi:hypothetical protein
MEPDEDIFRRDLREVRRRFHGDRRANEEATQCSAVGGKEIETKDDDEGRFQGGVSPGRVRDKKPVPARDAPRNLLPSFTNRFRFQFPNRNRPRARLLQPGRMLDPKVIEAYFGGEAGAEEKLSAAGRSRTSSSSRTITRGKRRNQTYREPDKTCSMSCTIFLKSWSWSKLYNNFHFPSGLIK